MDTVNHWIVSKETRQKSAICHVPCPEIRARRTVPRSLLSGRNLQGPETREDRPETSTGSRREVRLPGNGNSNSHGARPVHLIIMMIKWIRTSSLPIKNLPAAGLERHTKWWVGIEKVKMRVDAADCCRARMAHIIQRRP